MGIYSNANAAAKAGGSYIGGVDNGLSLNTVTGLEELAKANGFKESKTINALNTAGRVLNIGTATVAGAVRGALQGEGIIKGVKEGVENNIGFSEVYRDLFGKPDTKAGKVGVGVGGFAADVLFDPLTYLTFGVSAGLKVGGKVLTKGGTKAAQELSKSSLTSTRDILIKEGHSISKSKRIAETTSNRIVNDIFSKSLSKKGLDKAAATKIASDRLTEQLGRKMTTKEADNFISQVVSTRDMDVIMQSGTKLIDTGGIKLFGSTLVSSEVLANTPLGKASRRIGETEIAQAIKNTTGKMFVHGYGQTKKLLQLIEKGNLESRRAVDRISSSSDEVNKLFKDWNESERVEFFMGAFDKRRGVLGATKEIQDKTIKELGKLFPDLKIRDRDAAIRLLDSLDDVHHNKIKTIHDKMEGITERFFKERKARVAAKTGLPGTTDDVASGTQFSFEKIDKLNADLEDLKRTVREQGKELGTSPKTTKLDDIAVELSDESVIGAAAKAMRREEERLVEAIDKQIAKFRKLKDAPEGSKLAPKGAKTPKGKKLGPMEELVAGEELIKKLEKDYIQKIKGLSKIVDAKKVAKLAQKDEKLEFFLENGEANEKLNKAAEALFEGDNAFTKKLAKEAGISEEDAFKFYLPSKFRDRVTVKEYAMGRFMSSASKSYRKTFDGVLNDQLIKDPEEALKRTRLEVKIDKIKTDTVNKALGIFGKDITKEEAKRMGYKKFSRDTAKGTVSSFVPKEIAEELNKFVEPGKSVADDFAKAFGLDWATGLFKGYVTSLFPAFHMRNMTSNQFLLSLKFGTDTFNPAIQKRAMNLVMRKNLDDVFTSKDGVEWTNRKLLKAIQKETDFLDEGAFGNTEQMLQGIQEGGKWNPFSRNNVALKFGRNIGSKLESQAKLTGVIASVMEGKPIRQAISEAEDALFNYGKITPFERSIMRRIIPFYTFARKNFEYQIKSLAKTPGRSAAQIKFIRGVGETVGEPITAEDEEGLPSWVVDSLGIKAGTNQFGQDTYLTGFGLPIEEFLQRFSGDKGIVWNSISNEMAKMNPALKFPLERATGIDFFRGRPITEITNGGDLRPILDMMPDGVSDELKDLIQYKEREVGLYVNGKKVGTKTKVTADPFFLHWFRNIPTARIAATTGSFGREEEPTWMKAMRLTTGVRGETIDTSEQEFFNELKKRQELTDYLVRVGVIGTKEIVYEKE